MLKITREKHLDHMVRVVPFLVGCYFIQCYVILQTGSGELTKVCLSVLGGLLALMIGGFVTYDLKHEVELFDDHLKISFLQKTTIVRFSEIASLEINEPGQSFATLSIKTRQGVHHIRFIDDAEKISSWIDDRRIEKKLAA